VTASGIFAVCLEGVISWSGCLTTPLEPIIEPGVL